MRAIAICNATAYAYGSMKKEAFMKFLDTLDPQGKVNDGTLSFEQMKKAGFPVEDK